MCLLRKICDYELFHEWDKGKFSTFIIITTIIIYLHYFVVYSKLTMLAFGTQEYIG